MKKCGKRILAVLLALCCFCASVVSASAIDADLDAPIAEARYTGAVSVSSNISVSTSGTATCTAVVQIRSGYTAKTTLKLQRSSNNSKWSTRKSWTGTDGVLTKTKSVAAGYYYRAQVSTKVYNSSGTLVDSITKSSSSVYYS